MTSSQTYLWESIDSAEDAEVGAYHSNPRVDLLSLLRQPPSRLLDVGCASGAMGAWLKQQFPKIELWGIEANAQIALQAKAHYHRVMPGLLEDVDLAAHGLRAGSLDTLVLADVLEHMRNPWRALQELRQWLAHDAQVLVSLPNARNLWLLNELAEGRLTYEQSGILDITHLRFFTRDEGQRMLEQTGYTVEAVGYGPDSRFFQATRPTIFPANLETEHLVLKNVGADEYQQLVSLQIFYRAKPSPVESRVFIPTQAVRPNSAAVKERLHVLQEGQPQGNGTAVLLHLYYPELWPEFARILADLQGPKDFYVSLSDGCEDVFDDIVRDFPQAFVLSHPNRGRDIAPRLEL